MDILVAAVWALIYIAVILLVVYVLVWAIEQVVGQPIPARVKQLGMVILVLICFLIALSLVPIPVSVRWR